MNALVMGDREMWDPTVGFREEHLSLTGAYFTIQTHKEGNGGEQTNYTMLDAHELNRRGDNLQATTLIGDFVVVNDHFYDVYAHLLIDHFPALAWLQSHLPETTRFILPDNPVYNSILTYVDPEFVKNRILWVGKGEVLQITGTFRPYFASVARYYRKGGITLSRIVRPLGFVQALRSWLSVVGGPPQQADIGEGTIVYYSRSAAHHKRNKANITKLNPHIDASHGRQIEEGHERDIIDVIRNGMARHRRNERLVVFNGHRESDGKPMSFLEQRDLFSSASIVVGPHGGGMASIIFMEERSRTPPAVLEFICSPESVKVQSSCPWHKTFYSLWGTIPWIDYHHVPFSSNSTKDFTYVSLKLVDEALNALFARSEINGAMAAKEELAIKRSHL
eukprot:CAMPEP_0185759610 /NCGR_PEP_ID=MMETSP1174-20130828/18359_1 /TAXON_ID=35687 /ORGANISM="Dictyocha speculum, Strain CCMP1381" /LENGTH=391 /DNA_ID=CAMNT_0028440009 /DNA_START=80 /DNA_END=1255 /DNA_ORIENTATION=+